MKNSLTHLIYVECIHHLFHHNLFLDNTLVMNPSLISRSTFSRFGQSNCGITSILHNKDGIAPEMLSGMLHLVSLAVYLLNLCNLFITLVHNRCWRQCWSLLRRSRFWYQTPWSHFWLELPRHSLKKVCNKHLISFIAMSLINSKRLSFAGSVASMINSDHLARVQCTISISYVYQLCLESIVAATYDNFFASVPGPASESTSPSLS